MEVAEPPAKRARHGFDETFEVLVGSGSTQQRFTVHHSIFAKRSRFLKAARSSCWRSDPKSPVDLTDADPDVFADYMHCVYHDKVAAPEGAGCPFLLLFKLYLLADMLRDLATTNLVLDKIVEISNETQHIPRRTEIKLAYQSTVAGNSLRNLCWDLLINHAVSTVLETLEEGGELTFEFLRDIVAEFVEMTSDDPVYVNLQPATTTREKCYYHQHDDEHPKCS